MLRSIASATQMACRLEPLQFKLAAPLVLGPVSSERLWKAGQRAVSGAAEASSSKPSEEGSKEGETDSSNDDASAGNETSEGVNTAELQEALSASEAKVTELQAEMDQVKARSLQVLSDMENLRKRTSQQVAEAHQFALQGFCKNILDVADNLERALGSVPTDVLAASQDGSMTLAEADASDDAVTCEMVAKNLCSLHNGVAMSNKIMLKIFKDNGLEKVETVVGGEFDPNLHNAMFEVPTGEMEVGRIAAIMKQGYSLNGRVIRAADVGVAKPLDG